MVEQMSEHVKYYRLDKPRARSYQEFVCCDDEGWFYDWFYVNKKTGDRDFIGMVIAKDLPDKFDFQKRNGYVLNDKI